MIGADETMEATQELFHFLQFSVEYSGTSQGTEKKKRRAKKTEEVASSGDDDDGDDDDDDDDDDGDDVSDDAKVAMQSMDLKKDVSCIFEI